MGSLLAGYRAPQFSEDSAWLPAWFQQQHFQPLADQKDFMEKCTREDANMSVEDEGRYKSCHLFLSGEDMMPASCPSSANVMGFHLYLSPDGTSQDLYSLGVDTCKAGNTGSDYVALGQKTKLTASQKVSSNQCTMVRDTQETNVLPLPSEHETLEHTCLQSFDGNNDTKAKNQDNLRHGNVSELSEAVELSIAAAEALIVHDMVKTSSTTKCLSAASIIEVALRVKQARLEGSEGGSYSSEDDIDDDESMSDFQELNMAHAYLDVGLNVCCSDDVVASAADIFQVEETPNSETHSLNVSHVDTFIEEEPTDTFNVGNQERKNLSSEHLVFDGERKLKDYLTTSARGQHNDIELQWSPAEKSNAPAATEALSLSLENATQTRKKAKEIRSTQTGNSVNDERDDQQHIYGPVKFESRWLGGWLRKTEINTPATIPQKNSNLITKHLVHETSYLSESADVAPDENSHVQIQDEGSHVASQPSILFKGLHDEANDGVIFSLDTPVPYCLSSADPLCSFVPCSLPSENACPSKVHDLNVVEDTEESLGPALENGNDNLRRTSTSNAEFSQREQQPAPKANGVVCHTIIRRQLTSLRNYSMLLPQCSLLMEKDGNHSKGLVTPPNNSILLSTDKTLYVRGIEENHEVLRQITGDEPEIQAEIGKGKGSPLILDRGKRQRFSAPKAVDLDLDRGKTLGKAKISRCDVALPKSNLQKDQLMCGVAHDPEIQARKKVRFSETCTRSLQKAKVHKQSSYIECSAARTGKRIKVFNGRAKNFYSNTLHRNAKKSILQNLDFLLTGFPGPKEREIKNLIRKHGGTVLPGIPTLKSRGRRSSRSNTQQHPIVLCPHKLETTEFLYGCVVNAFILGVDWLTDSVKAGSALAPDKYMVIMNHAGERNLRRPFCRNKHSYLFDEVGIMLHGKHSFCTRLATVIKHGGGKVFKTLQSMVQNLDAKNIALGIIVAEDKRSVSRHLKHCASEGKIHTVTASWIIKSLHAGELLPFAATIHSSCLPMIQNLDYPDSEAFSDEI